MGERIVKLQQKLSFKPTATTGHQAIPTPAVEGSALRTPPEALLSGRGTESQAPSAPIRYAKPNKARSGSHDPEKGLSERHPQSTHNVPYGHSRVTYANPEDDGDEDRPKEHAIWILVGLFYFHNQSSRLTYAESLDLPVCPVASSRPTNSNLYHAYWHSTSAAPSTVLLLEAITNLRTLSSTAFATTRFSTRAHILFLRHE